MTNFLKLVFLFIFFTTNAQIHEIGGFAGGSNYIGDVGSTTYISPNRLALGLIYKWNVNPRLAYRFSVTGAYVFSDDKKSNDPSREQRGYQFSNTIREFSAGIEFNFFKFDLFDIQKQFTPYVHTGINYMMAHDAYSTTKIILKEELVGTMAVPITLGIKTNVFPHFVLGFEVGARYTFTDNFDGSNPGDSSLQKFGNTNNNDWYVLSGFTLTYTFGKKTCYCLN